MSSSELFSLFFNFLISCIHPIHVTGNCFLILIPISRSYISIDFPSMQFNLSLPPAVKCKNGAIRGMWLSYDHYSDFCPSFQMPGDKIINMDLSEAAKKEWKKRKELEKTARAGNDSKPQAGAVPFDSFELLNMPIVDVDKLYMDYINDIMKKDRLRKGRNALNLKEFEINLRQYRIVGGIYSLDYFEQPEQSVKLSAKAYLRTSESKRKKEFFIVLRESEICGQSNTCHLLSLQSVAQKH